MIHRAPTPSAPPRAARRRALPALALLVAALVSTAALTPAVAAVKPTLTVLSGATLTLPAGDGFKDSATLDIRSNSKIIVKAELVERSSKDVVGTIMQSLRLVKKGSTYRGDLRVTAAGLDAGKYLVRVTDRANEKLTDDVTLTIGSGKVSTVSLSPAETVLYPLDDGYLDTLHASVVAKDETGTTVPVSGKLTVTSAGTQRSGAVTSTSDLVTRGHVDIAGLKSGTAKVRARVTGPAGPSKQSASAKLTLSGTRVKSLLIERSHTVVYPATDGYQDSVAVTVSAQASVPREIDVTGSLTISRKGVRAASWKLSSSSAKTVTWNGRIGKKIVPGTYTVAAIVKGEDGPSVIRTSTIVVSKKSLRRTTVSTWRSAKSILTSSTAYDAKNKGGCVAVRGAVDCTGYDASRDNSLSLFSWGTVAVPDAVRTSTRYQTPTIRVTADVRSLHGSGTWKYEKRTGTLAKGSHTLASLPLNGNPGSIDLSVSLKKNTTVTIQRFRLQYRYTVLH